MARMNKKRNWNLKQEVQLSRDIQHNVCSHSSIQAPLEPSACTVQRIVLWKLLNIMNDMSRPQHCDQTAEHLQPEASSAAIMTAINLHKET